jgi:tRNA A-37 threonylcarbamoyl transferase component Bud32
MDSAPPTGFQAPAVADLARLLPHLEVLELVGCGGMGAVYRARQPELDRVVALKILPRSARDPAEREQRFLREARALARLSHPNIVAVHDFGKVEGLFYFVMEYVEGITLRDALRNGRLAVNQALDTISQLCDSLQFAHSEGVIHRDIKPENILIDRRGRVRVADFGLAKLAGAGPAEQNLTAAHQVMGTMRYMAPEQMAGSTSVDHRADLYSLGVVFYELLTGELPMGWFAPPSRKAAVDARLDEVVLRSLESEPARRYQQASELKSAVSGLAQSLPGADNPPVIASRAAPAKPPRGESRRVYRLLDETETKGRRLHHLLGLAGVSCLALGATPALTRLLFRAGEPSGAWLLMVALGGFALGVVLLVLSALVKRRLRWTVDYKGHTILFDGGGMWAERLYLDGGLVQQGGFGLKMEIRTPIRVGEGIGDEIVVLYDARFTHVRIRIMAEELPT